MDETSQDPATKIRLKTEERPRVLNFQVRVIRKVVQPEPVNPDADRPWATQTSRILDLPDPAHS